jgi:hypothetical protein
LASFARRDNWLSDHIFYSSHDIVDQAGVKGPIGGNDGDLGLGQSDYTTRPELARLLVYAEPKVALAGGDALVGDLAIPFYRLGAVLGYAVAHQIHSPKVALAFWVALVCGPTIEFHRLAVILGHPPTVFV